MARDQQAIEGEIVRKLNMQQENRKDLDVQIRQKEDVAAFEREVNRQQERTSFGPEEDHMLYEVIGNRRAQAKHDTKLQLLEMIKERAERREFMHELERSIDANVIDQTVQAYHEEQRERKALEKERMNDMRNAWLEQAFVNEKARDIDNLFN